MYVLLGTIKNPDGSTELAYITKDSIIRRNSNLISCSAPINPVHINLMKSAKQIIRKNNVVKLISSDFSLRPFEIFSESYGNGLVSFYDDNLENNLVYEFCRDFFNFLGAFFFCIVMLLRKGVRDFVIEKIKLIYSKKSKQTTRVIESQPSELEEIKIGTENADSINLQHQGLYELYESKTCYALRKLLRENNIPQAGPKADLVERMVSYSLQHKNTYNIE